MTPERMASKVEQARSSGKSPSRIRYGKNGRMRVTRIRLRCLCGDSFDVLIGARIPARAVCSKCMAVAFEIRGSGRDHDTILIELVGRKGRPHA